uniref:Peptidase A1 domain-containing protein n=2 Tax=Hordeum vulgare subsp. vulgare TaxID=112509 RepID=A0A8I7BE16_HORVV
MIKKPEYPSFYFVELASINIGGYVLPVPPSVFTSKGTLLDSGTTLTYIPDQAYTLLRDRFKFTMKGNKPAPPFQELDTCYDFSGQSAIFIPGVSFKFSDGAVFELDFFGIMMFPDAAQPAYGCLAFAAGEFPFSAIGNTQQRSAEVIYNVASEKIGFVPFSC